MSDCIEFEGARHSNGYGSKYLRIENGRRIRQLAHRWAWEQVHGPIPPGMYVLHSCDNPPCINIEHLSLGTPRDNQQDMLRKGRGRWNGKCKNGHDLEETARANKDGIRFCEVCSREYQREYYHRNREKVLRQRREKQAKMRATREP